nr:NAD-dependent epimerase/dehydratase family protein [Psychrobacillus glaciei]
MDKIQQLGGEEVIIYEIDLTDKITVEGIFQSYKIDGVIYFAGLKAVGESVEKPLKYYMNNLVSTMVLAVACLKYNVGRFVFSSSATVYGDNQVPFVETMDLMSTTNPYGETKIMSERILTDIANVNPNFAVTILRFFIPVGAHQSGLIVEAQHQNRD